MGLKRVRTRRNDALAAEAWDRIEALLAEHYRRQGYQVEHCGTGGRGTRFDGGVDLRLHRGSEAIVVQCKHWNAYKVPHNDVHQLLGIMVNEQATGAILVTSGEFTKAAIEAAGRHGHVTLVDGDELREMLGPLPATAGNPGTAGRAEDECHGWGRTAGSFGAYAAERLVAAAEERLRHGSRRRGSLVADAAWSGLAGIVLKFVIALALLWFLGAQFQRVIRNIAPVQPQPTSSRPASQPPARAAMQASDGRRHRPAPPPIIHQPSPAELEQWRRRNAESMRILEESTPELPDDPRRRAVL